METLREKVTSLTQMNKTLSTETVKLNSLNQELQVKQVTLLKEFGAVTNTAVKLRTELDYIGLALDSSTKKLADATTSLAQERERIQMWEALGMEKDKIIEHKMKEMEHFKKQSAELPIWQKRVERLKTQLEIAEERPPVKQSRTSVEIQEKRANSENVVERYLSQTESKKSKNEVNKFGLLNGKKVENLKRLDDTPPPPITMGLLNKKKSLTFPSAPLMKKHLNITAVKSQTTLSSFKRKL
jgi:hypothetical protein